METEPVRAVLVAARGALAEVGGGVQQAAREYIAALELAGCNLETVSFDVHATVGARLWNRIRPKVMLIEPPRALLPQLRGTLRDTNAAFVFFLPNILPAISRAIRHEAPYVRQLLLSVGVESIDFCVDQQIRRRNGNETRPRGRVHNMLGRQLVEEAEQRALVDAVLTMSPLEAEVEKWLGAPRALWLPRTVTERPLVAQPVESRVGCVSTLNHPPNLDGLLQLLERLHPAVAPTFRFRLVGSPEKDGRQIAKRFPMVDYLGKLDDAGLREEAATWSCFVHPLFVYAKGSSTKLAVGLGWGLPIATTEFGARGYYWNEDVLPLTRTPDELARLVIHYAQLANFESGKRQVAEIVSRSPTLEGVAAEIRRFLLELNRGRQIVPDGIDAAEDKTGSTLDGSIR
jgi:hypothetical protein